MFNPETHATIINQIGYDPVVILLLVRGVVDILLSFLFFLEPSCRGKNRTVHWMVGALFAVGAYSAFDRALDRMQALATTGAAIPAYQLFWGEMLWVAFGFALAAVIVYQHFRDKTLQAHKLPTVCDTCSKNSAVSASKPFSDTLGL